RTKAVPLVAPLRDRADAATRAEMDALVRGYADAYEAYFAKSVAERKVERERLDPWPRVVLVPGLGAVTFGKTLGEATTAADICEHTATVIEAATALG